MERGRPYKNAFPNEWSRPSTYAIYEYRNNLKHGNNNNLGDKARNGLNCTQLNFVISPLSNKLTCHAYAFHIYFTHFWFFYKNLFRQQLCREMCFYKSWWWLLFNICDCISKQYVFIIFIISWFCLWDNAYCSVRNQINIYISFNCLFQKFTSFKINFQYLIKC